MNSLSSITQSGNDINKMHSIYSYTNGKNEEADLKIKQLLEGTGITKAPRLYVNLRRAALIEQALRRKEGYLSAEGAFVVKTGRFTGRAAGDKFIVDEPEVHDHIWWGDVNNRMSTTHFNHVLNEVQGFLQANELFIQDLYASRDPSCCTPVKLVTTNAWHAMFARNMFVRPEDISEENKNIINNNQQAPFTILHAPGLHLNVEQCGTHQSTAIITSFKHRLIVICGTNYAGEIKKSIFSAMNWQLPSMNILSMHCSANIGKQGDSALFFGLSGTGKTTLSSDPHRSLIGDDEHGWSDKGVFNIEGGCYAKVINLSQKNEPEIWNASQQFGAVLENVITDEHGKPDFYNNSITENTRACYPVDFIPNTCLKGQGGQPQNVIMLTADAFGVLPPISRLTPAQAVFHFLMGYTARVAGTESGLGKEPQATFSPCFAAPFLPRPPDIYGTMLLNRLEANPNIHCWLLNTGWSGGPYGVGQRLSLPYTRKLLHMALDGSLNKSKFHQEPFFGLSIPTEADDIPKNILNPALSWADAKAYEEQAKDLAQRFRKHYETFSKTLKGVITFEGDIFSPNLKIKRS